jgi:hypothetical protein
MLNKIKSRQKSFDFDPPKKRNERNENNGTKETK